MAPHVDAPEPPAWNTRDIEELGGNAPQWSNAAELRNAARVGALFSAIADPAVLLG